MTRIQARLAARLLALTFFLFVAMDLPSWARDPRNRFALALALRELSFGGGALALAASLGDEPRDRAAHVLATARWLIAVAVLFFSVAQFRHGDYPPFRSIASRPPGSSATRSGPI